MFKEKTWCYCKANYPKHFPFLEQLVDPHGQHGRDSKATAWGVRYEALPAFGRNRSETDSETDSETVSHTEIDSGPFCTS
jgi:hypothetical protein